MRILLCELKLDGHRKNYAENLIKTPDVEFFAYTPENIGLDAEHYIPLPAESRKTFRFYRLWLRGLRRAVKEHGIDCVHLLDGDSLMRYFGYGLSRIAPYLVVTYHLLYEGFLRKISYKRMIGKRATAVVHTENVYHRLSDIISKDRVELCRYPAFSYSLYQNADVMAAKKFWNLPENVPTFGILGATSAYKNIEFFLRTLQKVSGNFHILIAGKPTDLSKERIGELVFPYKKRVTLCLKTLTDKEYNDAIIASDFIYCLYGREFNAASGPLTDGVCAKKFIFGSRHGSIGEIIESNHLGVTAECDDEGSVIAGFDAARTAFYGAEYDETAKRFAQTLNPDGFVARYREIYQKRL